MLGPDDSFPGVKAYSVVYEGGSCGAFLSTIIYLFHYGRSKTSLSGYGNAHDNITNLLCQNYNSYGLKEWNISPEIHSTPFYEFVTPVSPLVPFIFVDHAEPDFDRFHSLYPDGKLIVITAEQIDAPRIIGNIVFKQIVEYYDKYFGIDKGTAFTSRLAEFPDLQHKHPNELTVEDWERVLNDKNYVPIFKPFTVEGCHQSYVFQIRMRDIIHDKTLVLEQLSEITGEPINEHIHQFYDEYLMKQQELVKTKMPWVTV